ncbi:toll-like receptor 6 [Varanus komodoensis]|uniref:toll-like receptor 6 n=1 Tax=Varanus komodoensis TaxID=61221 RepID=UPI001CF7EAFA|nr:toll-like receptor 6 [Varanus komodoensis]
MKVIDSQQFKQVICKIADQRSLVSINFLIAFTLTISFWTSFKVAAGNGFSTDYSKRLLTAVPKNLSTQTTVLDLSHNNIAELQTSDFHSLSRLRKLILSYNRIREFDFSVFQYNTNLEHLDVSHNNLQMLSCHPMLRLRHLDLSYNNYIAMPICPKTGKTLKLEYLGLSLKRIQKSDFHALAHLQLHTLFLDLENLSEYSSGNLLVFNTKNLHIALPQNSDFHLLSDLELNFTETLKLSKFNKKYTNDLRKFLLNIKKISPLLILNNVRCNWEGFIDILQTVWESTTETVVISNIPRLEVPNKVTFTQTKTSLKALIIRQITFTTYFSAPTVVALVAISVLCICLDIPWYLKMTWHWSQVKHRGWKRTPEHILKGIEFHAFISYSERDSDWVKNVLIPNLEKEDSSIRVCQHERNFVAGKSIKLELL